jgi:serine/threonine-protein kinase
MSELGFQQTAGSSGQGLTFVRPLPQGGAAPLGEGERSSVKKLALGLTERLFPPRAVEESGGMPPVTGLELGHFVIEERIGRGGMGAVFRALDKRLDRVVAVKILSPEHSVDMEAVQRFQNEARAAAKLDHDNIARVHYAGEEYGLHFIAFEFVTGTNIRNLIVQKGPLPSAEAVSYTLQIAEALRQTAAANVVHRDIKPSNIIVSTAGRAKLVDLGLARQVNPELSRDLTVAGTALGTFDYIAPEQALDARNVDVRSDIYSLGCTLYHMLTGAPPYPTGTMFEKVMNHHRASPPDPRLRNTRISPQLSRIVQKMMASNPDERYASPDSLIVDLIRVAEGLGLEPASPETVIWTRPPAGRGRSRWDGLRTWSGVAAILVFLVLADHFRSQRGAQIASGPSPSLNTEMGAAHPKVPDPASLPPFAPPAEPVAATNPAPPARAPESLASPRNETSGQTLSSIASGTTAVMSRGESGLAPNPPAAPRSETPVAIAPPPASPAAPTAGEQFVIVDPETRERSPQPSFLAACKSARNGGAIEIHAAGPLTVQPLTIADKNLIIRPGKGFRPLLRFDAATQMTMGALTRAAEMIRVEHGSLELYDLDIELTIDAASIADWSLLALANGGRLRAQGVSFTVINPGGVRAALSSPRRAPISSNWPNASPAASSTWCCRRRWSRSAIASRIRPWPPPAGSCG